MKNEQQQPEVTKIFSSLELKDQHKAWMNSVESAIESVFKTLTKDAEVKCVSIIDLWRNSVPDNCKYIQFAYDEVYVSRYPEQGIQLCDFRPTDLLSVLSALEMGHYQVVTF